MKPLVIELPPGTKVSFEKDSLVYKIDYQELLGPCPKNCNYDHDCYKEPYVAVIQETRTAFPLSKLEFVFDESGYGKSYNS